MKTRLLAVLLLCLPISGGLLAQSSGGKSGDKKSGDKKAAPAKSPADAALDAFNKARGEQGGKFDQARFQRIINSGLSYVMQYPTHSGANTVIRDLPKWASNTMRDKNLGPQRIAFLSQLKYEVVSAKFKEGLSADAKAAIAALDASTVDAETREMFTRQNLDSLREKIDMLAAMPGGGRYLTDRERSYVEILMAGQGSAKGEEHLQKLLQHSDKGVAGMARQELNLAEVKRTPVDLKFTALDGKPVDLGQLRGKVVGIYFFTTTNRDASKSMDTLKQIYSSYRKRGLEVVGVSFDKAEDREKLTKFVKDNRITFPVHYDGKGTKMDFAVKMNVTGTPRLAIFDKAGLLQSNNLQLGQLEGATKMLIEPPKKK
ncbi:MAG: TlpA disulfide reductase family protein [Opitutaceae bacterium]|nr:TlpA disulfide reductase family protein [Opitutaceae bacterium]